ncbi:MAG: hypothetical protein IT439_10010 [Phycisphaerales bacterium]|nr:hypothetical protein [Phycisphaerales bacterium]
MSDFGMRMPGGRAKRAAGVDVYTGLMGLAVAFLLLACVVLYMQGSKIGKDGSAIGIQEPGKIVIKDAGKK